MTRINGNVNTKPGPLKTVFLVVGWFAIIIAGIWIFGDSSATTGMIIKTLIFGIVVAAIGHNIKNNRWEGGGKIK